MYDNFAQLYKLKDRITEYETTSPAIKFYQQEVLRFISIAGTLKANNLEQNTQNIDSRYFSHILARSLLENFFTLIYLFDKNDKREERFNEILNGFKQDYIKLYNEAELPYKENLTSPQQWNELQKGKDIKSMLDAVRNENGERLGYLYFVFRITSFDVHGKNLPVFLDQSFTSSKNFPVLYLDKVFNLIVSEYLEIWQKLESE